MENNISKGEHFQYNYWYELFKAFIMESAIIPLPQDFINYLKEDGIILSKDDQAFPDYAGVSPENPEDLFGSGDDDSDSMNLRNDWTDLKNQIKKVIDQWGGVFPKLNWSAPRDATIMIPDGSLKCRNPDQVILVLKSSDIIAAELNHLPISPDTNLSPYYLVLKKYSHFTQSSEFRCFVRKNILIGISQRYYTKCFNFLIRDQEKYKQQIYHFFYSHIYLKFPEEDYVFDIAIPSDKEILIIDFGRFNEVTDSCLFNWEELFGFHPQDKQPPLIKVLEDDTGIQPNDALFCRVPYDLKDYSTEEALKDYLENIKFDN